MVRTKLSDLIVRRLPRVLVNRYMGASGSFWVDTYNDLLGELERQVSGPNGTIQIGLPWDICQDEVILPPQLVDVTRAFRSVPGSYPAQLDIAPSPGGFFITPRPGETIPAASQFLKMDQINSVLPERGRDFLFSRVFSAAGANPVNQVGDAILIHDTMGFSGGTLYDPTTPPKAGWILLTTTDVASAYYPTYMGQPIPRWAIPYEAGEYDWAINPATDLAWTFRDFLIVEGHRRYRRLTALDNETLVTHPDDRSSLPPDWDDLVAAWLRFKGELQTDQDSKQTAQWAQAWQSYLARWKAFHSKTTSSFRQKGLRIMPQFSGGR